MPMSANGVFHADSTMGGFSGIGNTAGSLITVLDAVLLVSGWEKVFTATNKAVYRSLSAQSNKLYLRIDDTTASGSRVRGYEAMTDIDTEAVPGVGLFPTEAQIAGGGWCYKSGAAGRPWRLVTDGRSIYFFTDPAGNASWAGGFCFVEMASYTQADAFGTLLIYSSAETNSWVFHQLGVATQAVIARSYTQTGGAVLCARYSHPKNTALGAGGQTYPAPADNSLHLWPVECWEGAGTLARGMMPGLWCPVHSAGVAQGATFSDFPQLPDRTLIIQTTGASTNRCAIDITGPWL